MTKSKKCPECKTIFKNPESWFNHLKQKHPAILACIIFYEAEQLEKELNKNE